MYSQNTGGPRRSGKPFNSRAGGGRNFGGGGGGGRGRSGGYRGGGGGGRGRGKSQQIDERRFVKAAKPVETVEYQPKNSFNDFNMANQLKENLAHAGFVQPTQIQDESIPTALEGRDIIGIANTGTGKTAAFLLPLIESLMNNKGKRAIIMAPTRELALQIEKEARNFSFKTGLWTVLLIGGVPIGPQIRGLKKRPEIIIGTPGRIKDHIERRTVRLDEVDTVVLDEVDRMLDMGFINDIREILSQLPKERRSLFFSATMTPAIERLISDFSKDPVKIMARTAETSDNVEQRIEHFNVDSEKFDQLHDILSSVEVKKALVFSETKRNVERLNNDLNDRGHRSDAMHGNKSQGQRQRALRNFKESRVNVLVATDVAARGIDVDGITHVINYDVPQTYDDYTHRIGRTGRGNATGNAITFVKKRRPSRY